MNEMMDAMSKQVRCQEASPLSQLSYIPCGQLAHWLVDNGDSRAYLMCDACADHNVRNRGRKIIARVEKT